MSTSFAAIVVAAGAGTRFGADRPKALLQLGGRSLVRHAADAMLAAGAAELVVVIPDGWQNAFAEALEGLTVATVAGGVERTDSVRHGLEEISADRTPVTLITDAARPLVPPAVVDRVVQAVAAGAPVVIPSIPVTDTIRELDAQLGASASIMLERSRLRAVQTPQGFDTVVLLDAYRRLGAEVVTDDAGVCERAGHRVQLVDGAAESFKITYPADLRLAELTIIDREGV
jgi:2-C-methyl-D-erythritol 4-phosphate cytidylyltransferase